VGAIVPGLLLVTLYILYLIAISRLKPELAPVAEVDGESSLSAARLLRSLLPPVVLIVAVLGSILSGAATPTEAAGVGAMGATLLALGRRQLTIKRLRDVTQSTTEVTAMVFLILIGAAIFSLIFRGFGGEELMEDLFTRIPGGVVGATLVVMVVIFLLGFILDFIEITFVVVPIVGPILLAMGLDPVWLGIMIAINLQTSFLTPPFGFALFYLRGVAPPSVATRDIYRGVVPFIIIQLLLMLMLAIWPSLATWLPSIVF
jgi:tripartite ATP-independent transporter DctM subunit